MSFAPSTQRWPSSALTGASAPSTQRSPSSALTGAPTRSTQRWPSSSLAGASKVLSTTTKTHNGMTKYFVFGSEWNFKPEGVKSVNSRFQKELNAKNLTATILWNGEDDTFRISCPHTIGEVVWETYFRVVEDLINQESGDGWEHSDDDSNSGVGDQDSDDEKPTKSNKLQRLSAFKEINVPETTDDADEGNASDSYQPILGTDFSDFPDKVRFYKAKVTWEYQATNPSLDEVIPDEVLLKLAGLIDGDFVKDLNQGKIYIGASCEEESARAICKLDNIRKNWDLRYTYVKHLIYGEELEKYEVSFKYIADVKKKFFETTLLDNLHLLRARFDYYNLQSAVTVRCATFNTVKSRFTPFKVGKYSAAVDFDNKDAGRSEWRGFEYAAYTRGQDEQDNAMTRFGRYSQGDASQIQQPQQLEQSSVQEQDVKDHYEQAQTAQKTIESIQRWKASVPGRDLQPLGSVQSHIQSDHGTSHEQQMKPNWDLYLPYTEEIAKSKKKHAQIQNHDLNATVSALFKGAPNLALVARKALSEQTSQLNRPQAVAASIVKSPNQHPSPSLGKASQVPLSEDLPQLNNTQTVAINRPGRTSPPNLLQDSPKRVTISNSPETPSVELQGDALASFIGLASDLVKVTDKNIVHLNALHPPLLPVRNGRNLSPPSAKESSSYSGDPFGAIPPSFQHQVTLPEALQQIDEVATRNYRFTMNQKAPKPNNSKNASNQKASKSHAYATRLEVPTPPRARRPPPSVAAPVNDPTPGFIADINESFCALLQGIRGFQGEVVIQAEFGRILMKRIPRKVISVGDSEASIEPDSGRGVLENPGGPSPLTIFTKILTALPADISYLIRMTDLQGNSLWKQEQSSWDVYYEILCVDGRRPFTIEINGETLEARVKTKYHFGEVNVHAIKRHWDFRISATGIEASRDVDPAYIEFAEIVKKTLYIPDGLRNPMLFFEIPDSFAHFAIHGVRVRRISRYPSFNTKSLLNVAEVRELQMDEASGDSCMVYKWFGSLDPSTWLADFGYKHLFLWHEVSISCPMADEILEQNKTLELGEEAFWTPEMLSNVDAVPSIYLPACIMVKQMDGIGFYNNNEMTVQTAQSSSVAETETAPPWYFW